MHVPTYGRKIHLAKVTTTYALYINKCQHHLHVLCKRTLKNNEVDKNPLPNLNAMRHCQRLCDMLYTNYK